MADLKRGPVLDRIQDYLGQKMNVDLKNHHKTVGTLVFYHLTEQMIHMIDWIEYDEDNQKVREGKYIIINRTAWFQFYQ